MSEVSQRHEGEPDNGPPSIREARDDNHKVFRAARSILLVVLICVMGFWLIDWIKSSFLYVHETDSRVMTDLITVSSEVDGRITHRLVSEGDTVSTGDTLIRVDSHLVKLKLQQIKAERATQAAELARVSAEYNMIRDRIETRIISEKANLDQARANQQIFIHEVDFLAKELKRVSELLKTGAAARSRVDRIKANFLKAQQQLIVAKTSVSAKEALVKEAMADRALLPVKKAEKETLTARLVEVETKLRAQVERVRRFDIVTSTAGIVSRTHVNEGEFVSKGQRLLVLHDPENIWIETNIRETEIERLTVGQDVKIEVDAYPDEEFHGKISRIGNAVTSQFGLLPNLNEAGNFTKVTQRIRVRIDTSQRSDMLRPGMMVEVFIQANNGSIFGRWLQ